MLATDRRRKNIVASRWPYFAVVCAIYLITCPGVAQTASKALRAQVRIILVGDSTMAVQSGWGPGFCALLSPRVYCVNMARSGRSSLSYRAEGAWAHVMEALKQNNQYQASYVLIQFGHNDQPGKPGRSTDVATEFPANLTRFVEEVRSTGARPVLVTPLERRVFRNGKLVNGLLAWADATRNVAAAEHVPLIDLNAKSFAAMQSMGQAEADTLAMAPPPADAIAGEATGNSVSLPKSHAPGAPELLPDGSDPHFNPVFDYTHLGHKGSAYFGQLVFIELQTIVPDLKPYLASDRERSHSTRRA
jgi:lysophospholipase L1-like esterase